MVKWAQEDVETLHNLLNNNNMLSYVMLRYALNVRTDSTSLLHIHCRHMAKRT